MSAPKGPKLFQLFRSLTSSTGSGLCLWVSSCQNWKGGTQFMFIDCLSLGGGMTCRYTCRVGLGGGVENNSWYRRTAFFRGYPRRMPPPPLRKHGLV